jgi:hypothetical protein
MQSFSNYLDIDNFDDTFGKSTGYLPFEYQKTQILNDFTFSYFTLEKAVGYKKALFIFKLNYWLNKCGRDIELNKVKWIYNTIESWAKQFNWSISTLKRIVYSLEKEGLIVSKKINAKKWNHTKWYSIDYFKLNSLLNINKKRTNRTVQKEPILISNNRNNYTNRSSYKKDDVELENTLKEKIEENPINVNEKEIVNKMVYIWNKVFEYSISPIKAYSNKKNQEVLLNLYKTAFSGDLNNWREYACKINSSQFLMGEKKTKNNFKAVFSWLIKEDTIEKIMNGEYGVGDRELDMNNITKNMEEKKEEVVNKMDKKISEYIKLKIDETTEKREFEEYVKINQAERKEDEYGILRAIRHISYHSIFRTNEYEVLRESLYESYVMKKYLGLTKMEARKKIMKRTSDMVDEKGINEAIIEELNKKVKEIEYFDISDGMSKIDLRLLL